MILFETDTSVFECLWDIILAIFIVRVAFIYFALTFITGCVLGYSREAHLIPIYHLSYHAAELVELPLMLFCTAVWARWSMIYYEVPVTTYWAGLRLLIGAVALALMLASEIVGGILVHHIGWGKWVWAHDSLSTGVFGAMLVFFAVMPWLLMVAGGKKDATYHGHEGKSLVHAFPIITKTEKKEKR